MTGWNLPPGVETYMIPGNTPEDVMQEYIVVVNHGAGGISAYGPVTDQDWARAYLQKSGQQGDVAPLYHIDSLPAEDDSERVNFSDLMKDMVKEYVEWRTEQGLPDLSPNALLIRDKTSHKLTPSQREWLEVYMGRWRAMVDG